MPDGSGDPGYNPARNHPRRAIAALHEPGMRNPLVFVTLCLLSTAVAADGALNEAYNVTNRNPLLGLYGLSSQQPSLVPGDGEYQNDFQLEIHNSFTGSDGDGDSIFLDGESTFAIVNLRRGFGNGWAGGVEIPVVNHDGGFLDGIIDDWHDLWGLDEFSRDEYPEDQLTYRYVRDGATRAEVDDSVTGLGDIRLHLGKQLLDEDGSRASAWVQLKLPTGDAEDLTGSGAVDVAARIQGSRRVGQYTTLYGGAGLAWLGEGDLLPEMQENFAGSLTAGLSWQRWERVALKLQFDAQTALYDDTTLRQIGEAAVQFSFGGSFFVGERTIFDVAAVEDEWNGEATPDFGIHLRLRRIIE